METPIVPTTEFDLPGRSGRIDAFAAPDFATDLCRRDVATDGPSMAAADAARLMRERGVRRLPVVGPQDRLVGRLALDDLAACMAAQVQALSGVFPAARRGEEAS